MEHKILMVDDDANLLKSYQRLLQRKMPTHVAESGPAGLKLLAKEGPFSIVISDYRMPEMDGVDFLAMVRNRCPDTVRMLLTGYADVNMALKAVNEGHVFRLLTKPCPPKLMARALADGIRQYELVTGERELLEKTVQGSVKMLADLTALVNPLVHGRSNRILPKVREVCRRLRVADAWEATTAATLCTLGYVVVPEDIVARADQGARLSEAESKKYGRHLEFVSRLLGNIPRLQGVARIFALQEKRFDGVGPPPEEDASGEDIPLGARILKACIDFDRLRQGGKSPGDALQLMGKRKGWYDPSVLKALASTLGDEAKYAVRKVYPLGLEPGMILDQDILGMDKGREVKVLAKGQELSRTTIDYLHRHAEDYLDITEPIRVMEPVCLVDREKEAGDGQDPAGG